jgi:hypothetical protein
MTVSDRKVDGWIEDIVGVLLDPIIVVPGGWGESLPEWLKKRVTMERLIENVQAIDEGRELTATDAEAVCYLFTASLTGPISGDWVQIYMYVAGSEMKDQTRNELPEDIKVDTLTENQWRELRHLKAWIYEQRVKYRKEKARGERREGRPAQVKAKEDLETKPVQQAFF